MRDWSSGVIVRTNFPTHGGGGGSLDLAERRLASDLGPKKLHKVLDGEARLDHRRRAVRIGEILRRHA